DRQSEGHGKSLPDLPKSMLSALPAPYCLCENPLRMRIFPGRYFLLCLLAVNPGLAWSQSASASVQSAGTFDWIKFHQQNDHDWAWRTGLSPREVRKLRLAAGVADDEPSNSIERIDAKILAHNQILFVTAAGSGHCLDIGVYVPYKNSFKNIWSMSEMPAGSGFCHPSLCRNPTVGAERGRITVAVPARADEQDMMCDKNILLSYRWKHKSYELSQQETVPAQCELQAFSLVLTTRLT